jgi:cell wall-associated NlpC family hydrolase
MILFLVAGGTALSASTTAADPSVQDVQARVDSLYHQAEQASERYNTAREQLESARERLASLRADLARQQRAVKRLREQVVSAVVAQSQGGTLTSTTKLILSPDPDTFLQGLVARSQLDAERSEKMADFAAQVKQLELRQAAADRTVDEIDRTTQRLAREKAEIDRKAHAAKELLNELKAKAAARRAARIAARREAARREAAAQAEASRSGNRTAPAPSTSTPTPSTPSAPAPSSGAQAAVNYALAQVGDAYVYGASGPDAFDCSGLTMMAWAQAGVSLPHSSSSQMSSGTPVSSSQLQPGDLVFYYSPVSHVGIYIGNGRIVHAANPSDGVLTAPVFSMPYSGAVRPG